MDHSKTPTSMQVISRARGTVGFMQRARTAERAYAQQAAQAAEAVAGFAEEQDIAEGERLTWCAESSTLHHLPTEEHVLAPLHRHFGPGKPLQHGLRSAICPCQLQAAPPRCCGGA
jgi:hypothetical protein